jgi:hypothetical protein
VPDFNVIYAGPISGVVDCARALAEADGVDLTGQRRASGADEEVARLELTVSGTDADVQAAIVSVSRELPPGASLTVQ